MPEESLHVITRDETRWLQERRNHHRRMAVYCATFTVLLIVVTGITHSVVFGVVALYFCFFTWNRWHEWRRTEGWLTDPARVDEQKRAAWLAGFVHQRNRLPRWERFSNWIAGVTLILVVLLESVFTLWAGGLWTRIVYGFLYGLVGLALFALFWLRRKARLGAKSGDAMPEPWDELT